MKDRIFICPKNDLEAVTIIDYLQRNGENVLITNQAWGATWEGLEPEIKQVLLENDAKTKVIQVEKEDPSPVHFDTIGKWTVEEYDVLSIHFGGGARIGNESLKEFEGTHEEYLAQPTANPGYTGHYIKKSDFQREKIIVDEIIPDPIKIYGIELAGNSEFKFIENIDHHNENCNKPCSLEQVAKIVGEPLTLKEQFIGANDADYISGMLKLAEERGLTDAERIEIISEIRLMDRQSQGITQEQEEIAQKFVDKLDISEKQDLMIIDNFPHSKMATLVDRLYEKGDNFLIVSTDGEINFSGKPEYVQNLVSECGGDWNGKGYWGSVSSDKEEIKDFEIFDITRNVDCAKILIIDYKELENENSINNDKKNENDNDFDF